MKRISTMFSDVNLIADELGTIVAIEENNEITFQNGDSVMVSGDSNGYITRGIHNEGTGTIAGFSKHFRDHFVCVLMEGTREVGWVKTSNLRKLRSRPFRQKIHV